MSKKGLFITFEGGEGSGKTTQIALLAKVLQDQGREVLLTREPGGEEGAERIRQLLVAGEADAWEPVAETLLFCAARVQHVARVIRPARAAGNIVLCDRFADSTFVYQGLGKQLGMAYIRQLHGLALGSCTPDRTFLLDLPVETGLARAAARHGVETRFERMDAAFHERIRQGFLSIAAAEPERCRVIDASQPPEAVHRHILAAL